MICVWASLGESFIFLALDMGHAYYVVPKVMLRVDTGKSTCSSRSGPWDSGIQTTIGAMPLKKSSTILKKEDVGNEGVQLQASTSSFVIFYQTQS